jgi:3-methyladenine DNA glycosylase/8-oxoguanine DNA glycosylase
VAVRSKGPFDLALSLRAAASFLPTVGEVPVILRTAVQLDGRPTILEIQQPFGTSSLVRGSSLPVTGQRRLREMIKWLISADLDLRPFHTLVAPHPIMGPVAAALLGLKPLRPATLFEMAIIAITEQQLSLAAAFYIRARLVSRFGTRLDGLWTFPSPERLAAASLRDLGACGLSHRKAEYVKDLARHVMQGVLDFDALRRRSDQRIREALLSNRGFGEWSVQYILGRGYGRPDCLASGDVGLQRVIARYFGEGRRLTAAELEQALSPFKPFRGLAAFYLSAHWRLLRAAGATPIGPHELASMSIA